MSHKSTLHSLAVLVEKSEHANVALAYWQTLTKSLTYGLPSEASICSEGTCRLLLQNPKVCYRVHNKTLSDLCSEPKDSSPYSDVLSFPRGFLPSGFARKIYK